MGYDPYLGWLIGTPYSFNATMARMPLADKVFDSTKLQGNRPSMMIIDDPHNPKGTANMKQPRVKTPKKDYNTVGVRFLRGHIPQKVYTYRVAKKAKLRLGEEVVVPTQLDGMLSNNVAVVVELHKTPQDYTYGVEYRYVFGRIQQL